MTMRVEAATQGVEIESIGVARDDVLLEQRVGAGAVVVGRQPEHRRVRGGLFAVVRRDGTVVADEGDELRHPRTEAAAQVRLVDVDARGQGRLAIGQVLRGRRLVRDQRPDVFRMVGDERKGVDRATTAGEQVHGAGAQRLDQPMHVVRVLVGRGFGRAGRPSRCAPRRGGRT